MKPQKQKKKRFGKDFLGGTMALIIVLIIFSRFIIKNAIRQNYLAMSIFIIILIALLVAPIYQDKLQAFATKRM